MEIINESATPTTRFDSIKWGGCFVHENAVFIRNKGNDSATRLSDGEIREFIVETLVQPVEAKVVVND